MPVGDILATMRDDDPWTAVTALSDVSRRALYDYVRRQDHPVSREEAGEAVTMSRGLAAFHLDKLVDVGLLRARYENPPDQPRGPGRAPKVYEALDDGVTITIPERRYQLIAEILADAVANDPTDAGEAAQRLAEDRGRELGTAMRRTGVLDVLTGLGFEPTQAGRRSVTLRNCPFHPLASRQTALVCGLNHAFLGGLLDGMRLTTMRAQLTPRPDTCCVEITPQSD